MTERTQLRVFALFIFLVVALSLSTASFAAISVIPDVPGLHGGGYTPSLGQLQGTQPWSSGGYSTTGTASIGGKPLSIPAKIPLASTAGPIIKSAMRLNPWAIAGTLAAGWLMDQGLEYLDGEWQKTGPIDAPDSSSCIAAAGDTGDGTQSGCKAKTAQYPDALWWRAGQGYRIPDACVLVASASWNYTAVGYDCSAVPRTRVPATPADFDNLPDPSEAVAPELPSAPYMPHGAPVDKPQYQPGDYPLGSPYKAPDGSTVQPMASVTNNNTTNNTTNNYNSSVTVSTYNITTHNADGTPTQNPTPEPTEEKQDQCEKYPDSLGCAKLGTPDPGADLPKTETPLTFSPVDMGGNASCPAPSTIEAFGVSLALEYDSACTYASGLKPVVIAVAFITALFIIFGAPRSAQS